MPFKSAAQIRKCYALKAKALAEKKIPDWNCDAWLKETKKPKKLPKGTKKK